MNQIIVSYNNQIVNRVKLLAPSYQIGRGNQCEIVLKERTISKQHARIINVGEDCFLEDTNSTNGVFINQNPIHKHLLLNNDIIQIGSYQLTFQTSKGKRQSPSPSVLGT